MPELSFLIHICGDSLSHKYKNERLAEFLIIFTLYWSHSVQIAIFNFDITLGQVAYTVQRTLLKTYTPVE